jgi:hypothetical protein
LVIQAIHPFTVESFPPLDDDLARNVKPLCDVLIFHAGSCKEDDLGTNHLAIRGCVLPGSFNENLLLGARKRDNERACTRHFAVLLYGGHISLSHYAVKEKIRHRISAMEH